MVLVVVVVVIVATAIREHTVLAISNSRLWHVQGPSHIFIVPLATSIPGFPTAHPTKITKLILKTADFPPNFVGILKPAPKSR
jgi:hypothetical protein